MSALAEHLRARRKLAVALAGPMAGIKMLGDPTIGRCKAMDRDTSWRVCQYAATILAKDPAFGGDLGHLFAAWTGTSEVVFYTAMREPQGDQSGTPTVWGQRLTNIVEVARVTLPAHVMAADLAGHVAERCDEVRSA